MDIVLPTLGTEVPSKQVPLSTHEVLPVRKRTFQNPGHVAVSRKSRAWCPSAGCTGQLASLSYSAGDTIGKRAADTMQS